MSTATKKARAVGLNHVALEVGDIEEALAFYGRLFEITLRGKTETSAFMDLGDQFSAFQKGRVQGPDDGRHFGGVSERSVHQSTERSERMGLRDLSKNDSALKELSAKGMAPK